MTAVDQVVDSELQERIREGAASVDAPGVAVGMIHQGSEGTYFQGVTSVNNPLPVDAMTHFLIGSNSKPFTATAMMRLVEAGKVRLEDPVRTYLPDLRLQDETTAAAVTVGNLLNHTSGWNGDLWAEEPGEGDDALERYAALLVRQEQDFALGSNVVYNNAAFNLAGRVIELVTGHVFEQAMRALVLDPLGLDETLYDPRQIMPRRFAAGHTKGGDHNEVVRPWNLPRSSNPAGGLCSTVGDQLRWARFHLGDGRAPSGERLLTPENMRLMQTPAVSAVGIGSIGISWMIKEVGGLRVVSHGGGAAGQSMGFTMVPERGFALTILCNTELATSFGLSTMQWALEHYLGLAETVQAETALTGEELRPYLGKYISIGQGLEISREGERTMARAKLLGKTMMEIEVAILPHDRLLVLTGGFKGQDAQFVRGQDGAIDGLKLGRYMKRQRK
jgi:CubicO group peptidase (beta-lactamase class C family)